MASACVPHSGTQAPPAAAKVVSLSQAASDCESNIRKQMIERKLGFQVISELSNEMTEANQMTHSLDQTWYWLDQYKGETTSIRIEYFKKTQSSRKNIKYEITKPGNGSEGLLNLSIFSEDVESTKNISLNQDFQVTQSCELKLRETYVERVQSVGSNQYTYSKTTYYSDKMNQVVEDKFSIPPNTFFINFSPNLYDYEFFPNEGFAYFGNVGVVRIEKHLKENKKESQFGLNLSLKKLQLDLFAKDKIFLKISVGIDEQLGVHFNEASGRSSWQTPKNVWEKSVLGEAADLASLVTWSVPKDYLKTHNSIQLITNKLPSYDHFSAYWLTSNIVKDEKSDRTTVNLTENINPTIKDSASEIDLVSNSTIQTNLPKIQEIANEIRTKEPKNRLNQVQAILEYLSNKYSFDYEMQKNNIVRPLTTEEALTRGKGVCQHYSVIFTAVARALKIPTRIVSGFALMGDKPGGHAWVESEIQPGLWRVIEPQDPTTLTQMNTRFYFPTERGEVYEDKTKNWAESIAETLSEDFTFKPL